MGLVHAYLPEIAIVGIENGDLVGLLDDLDADVPKYERDPAGPTLIARKRGRLLGILLPRPLRQQRAMPADDFRNRRQPERGCKLDDLIWMLFSLYR